MMMSEQNTKRYLIVRAPFYAKPGARSVRESAIDPRRAISGRLGRFYAGAYKMSPQTLISAPIGELELKR
jgi:hypothetical protein